MKRTFEGLGAGQAARPQEAEFFRLTGISPEVWQDDRPVTSGPGMEHTMPFSSETPQHAMPPNADAIASGSTGFDAFGGQTWSMAWPMSSMPMAMPMFPMAMGAQGAQRMHDFEEEEDDPLNPDNDPNRFSGRIKTYYETPGGGYGFIDCEAARMRYGRDVYLHSRQISDAKVGEMISFTIVRNGKGEPQARNVMRAEEAMALKAKIQKRARREQEQKRMKHQTLEKAAVPELRGVMSEEEAKRFQESLKKKRL